MLALLPGRLLFSRHDNGSTEHQDRHWPLLLPSVDRHVHVDASTAEKQAISQSVKQVLGQIACRVNPLGRRDHAVNLTPVMRQLRDGALCIAWLLAVCIALVGLIRFVRALIRGPAWQREAILPGVVPSPPLAPPPRPLSERFQPRTLVSQTAPDASLRETTTITAPTTAPAATPTHEEPAVSISVLGPLRIDGTNRPPKRVKTRELIAYLALHPHGASRDELTDAIWPDQDPKKTRARLWESASDAKAALGDAWIVEGDRYRLDRERLQIDLDQLDRLLSHTDSDDEATPAVPSSSPSKP